MRKLSLTFLTCLKSDFLSPVLDYVNHDPDLDLQIRDSYINIYYKGNSLLKLIDTGSLLHYKAEIHQKFLEGVEISLEFTETTVPQFMKNIPRIKENIIKHGKNSLELEYEQLIVRANNNEGRNNTEYFIIDRQVAVPEGRFDLTGIHWASHNRKKHQEVPVCLMEIKFALNQDIREVHNQLERYYHSIAGKASSMAEEMETIFRQRLELNLYHQPSDRLRAMKTLTLSRDIRKFQFILILVDYNQNSSLLDLKKLDGLPFKEQIKVFQTGCGMWQNNVMRIS